jgi:hypothetical protein
MVMKSLLLIRSFTVLSLLVFTFPSVNASDSQTQLSPENNDRHLREAAKYRFEVNNDASFDSDNLFSSGASFQLHTPVTDSWDKLEYTTEFVRFLGAKIPSLTADGLNYRASLSVGQIFQTPDKIEAPEFIPDDVPYAGVLTFRSSWIAFNDTDFRGFEIVVGVLGRPSVAEQTQNLTHKIIGSHIAEGWDNQLKTEPVINVNYMRKNKFLQLGKAQSLSFDTAISGDIQLGTLITATAIRLEGRLGYNMPLGFAYQPDSIGRTLTYDATLAPVNKKAASIYASLIVGTSYIAHNLVLDGNVFKDAIHSVEKEDVVSSALLGFHYERESWGLHFNYNKTTDIIDTNFVTGNADPSNDFFTLMIEWRI